MSNFVVDVRIPHYGRWAIIRELLNAYNSSDCILVPMLNESLVYRIVRCVALEPGHLRVSLLDVGSIGESRRGLTTLTALSSACVVQAPACWRALGPIDHA